MPTIQVKDANGNIINMAVFSGDGSAGNPFITESGAYLLGLVGATPTGISANPASPIANGLGTPLCVAIGIWDAGAGNFAPIEAANIGEGNAALKNIPQVVPQVYDGATMRWPRTPNVFKTLSAVVITSETTIWTPAAGKKFRLMGFMLTQGVVTGAVTIRDNTAGTTILIIPQTTIGVAIASPRMGNGILSAAANNVLTAQGASTETLTGFVFGTEE